MSKSNFGKHLQPFTSVFKQMLLARWRSLLTLLIGIYLPLQVFALLALEVRKNRGGFPWDLSVLQAIHAREQPQLNVFAATLTKFGQFQGIFPLIAAVALLLFLRRRWRALAYWIVTQQVSTIINQNVKLVMHRVRPHLWESFYPHPSDYAFPSGHAMASMTLVAALIILNWGSRWCWLTVIFGSVFAVSIAWTRLYLGVHFPSDILGGWMLSIAWTIAVSLLLKPNLSKVNTATNAPRQPS
jgi:undecaprenyl-diphosphatase